MVLKRGLATIESTAGPEVWLGANFWSRSGGPLMWREYDGQLIDQELGVLREYGLDITRSFFYWPDFMPEPAMIDEELVGRFDDFLDRHLAAGMRTIPTFIVGHMSGQNWDPTWRGGRDLYRDVGMVARQAWFVREMTARFAQHPAVAGWLISNEMPIYAGAAEDDVVASWAEIMVQAVRAGGGRQPVSLGDGAWGIEVTGVDNGYSVRHTAQICDFVGPHVYPMQDDVVRQHLSAAFACELAGSAGAPVVLEEFGLSSDFASAEHSGDYYRQVLHTSLLAGATGWLAWNNTDYDGQFAQDPYRHHPFEMHFGITDSSGSPKRPLRELAEFRETLRGVDIARCERESSQVAMVVPAYFESGYPLAEQQDRAYIYDVLKQAYIAGREADLRGAVMREADGLRSGASLYLVPSVKQLTAPSWYQLERLAGEGAVVYVSYGAGDHAGQRGPWYANLNELFGVEHQLRYGLVDPIEDDEVRLCFAAELGGIEAGTTLTFRSGGNEHSRSYLPVVPTEAEVVATDGHGRPGLLRRRIGRGAVLLCTYPLEHMAAANPRVNPEQTWRLYDALAEHAGVSRSVRVSDPRVLVDGVVRSDGRRFVWFVSESNEQLTVEPQLRDGELVNLDGSSHGARVGLEPYGVRVLGLGTRA